MTQNISLKEIKNISCLENTDIKIIIHTMKKPRKYPRTQLVTFYKQIFLSEKNFLLTFMLSKQ